MAEQSLAGTSGVQNITNENDQSDPSENDGPDEQYNKILNKVRYLINQGDLKKLTDLFVLFFLFNDINGVRAYIDAGVDVNLTNKFNKSALFYAAKSATANVAQALIDAGADVNIIDNGGETALFSAVTKRNVHVVRVLINAGADVNVINKKGKTALFYAGMSASGDISQALIDAGADVNIIDNGGETALFFAVTNRNVHVVRLLINDGADVNVINKEGETALFYAGTSASGDISQALIDAGADVNIIDNRGKTALFSAVTNRNVHVVRLLINADADVNVINKKGKTALFDAGTNASGNISQALIDAGTDINITDDKGQTALFYAFNNRNENTVRALIEAGVDVNVTDNEGKPALISAVLKCKESVLVSALIEAGADVNVTDNKGKTTLLYAVQQSDNESVVSALIEAGADVNVTDNEDKTALIYAAKMHNSSAVCALIENGNALVNAKDSFGRTALFYAIKDADSLSLAGYLLDKGGDRHLYDNYNVSILTFFIEDCHMRSTKNRSFPCSSHMTEGMDVFEENGIQSKTIFEALVNFVFCKIPTCANSFQQTSHYQTRNIRILHLILEDAMEYIAEESFQNNIIKDVLIMISDENACESLIPKILVSLIDLGANPNSVDSDGNTALHYATCLPFDGVSQETVMEICHQLHKYGTKFNTKNIRNETPLLCCLCRGFPTMENVEQKLSRAKSMMEVIRFLLQYGSKVKETTQEGKSIFHILFTFFSKETTNELMHVMMMIVQMISRADGIKGITVNQRDVHLNSPLHLWASMELTTNDYTDIRSVDDLTFAKILKTILELLLECGAKLNDRNANEETPLHLCRTWTAVKLLIDDGARPKDVDSKGRPPLLVAAKNKLLNRSKERFYPDVSQEPKEFWKTALENNLDPWTVDQNGESVLGVLIASEAFVLAKGLLEVARDNNYLKSNTIAASLLNAVCKDESSRTHWKNILVEIILKENPISINTDSPLHFCCRNIVPDKSIVRKKAKAEKKTEENDENAEDTVHWNITKQLLLYGADCTVPDATGQSCLDIAKEYPPLKDLLKKPIDTSDIPLLIPWTSFSKRYEHKLAKVARRQECKHVDSFWYYKEHLESGSFGLVFAGINEKDGREVAIKRIETLRMDRREDMREIVNLKALADCEQVIRYLSFFEDDVNHFSYVVLELMEGNLVEYLDSTFDVKESVKLCKDVVIGLNFLHALNILHRDLKPANILFKTHPKLCLKIADFGLSRRIDSTSTTVYGTNVGTKCWIAPEVLKSLCDHSKSSDIFACGLVLHYILSVKRHPFAPADCTNKSVSEISNETEKNVMKNTTKGWDDSLCPESTHLVKEMLESNKSKRPTAAEALAHPLYWSKKKKMELLSAAGNQPEFECPRAKRPTPLTAVETDLQTRFSTIVKYVTWNDPWYVHMSAIHAEMKKRKPPYDTHSVVELVRFIRNAIAHVSEDKRPTSIRKLLLEDFVFLEYFPNLVMEVYKAVTTHGWVKTREEIKYAINN